jgi:hypothetical protein
VIKDNDNILIIAEKNDLEKLEDYRDEWPLLDCRKATYKILVYCELAA